MKITKIKTKAGTFGSPVSAELGAIVERMQSADIKASADRIAAIALHSRLMMEQGAPRYFIEDTDRLPYLIFSSTFGKDGLSKPTRFTSLLLLNIPCPQGIRQIAEMKSRVRQIPYTMLAFAGVSGVTLKVLVRCRYDKAEALDADDYLTFLKDAHESAARLYTSLAQCNLYVKEIRLTNGCRMSYDPQLYYNPQAEILPVVREQQTDPLKQYEGTKAEEYTLTPRLCSFIATTNDITPLPSGDGTRRYLCVEVTDKVDMSGRIPYKQMFAQAVAELHEPGRIYWFTSDDEREIQQHNRLYQQESAPELMLTEVFEPTNQHKREHLWTASAIQQELAKHLRASDLPNLTNLGLALKKLRWKRYKVGNARGYYLRLRPAAR